MESTLVILAPEAEGLVQSFRDRYDPAAKAGMPAHITLLYPFKFSLMAINQFAVETLYLAPEPEEPFRELTLGIWRCYPETPPYRGRYSTIVPHLTVADRMGEQRLAEVAREFEEASQGFLPILAVQIKRLVPGSEGDDLCR